MNMITEHDCIMRMRIKSISGFAPQHRPPYHVGVTPPIEGYCSHVKTYPTIYSTRYPIYLIYKVQFILISFHISHNITPYSNIKKGIHCGVPYEPPQAGTLHSQHSVSMSLAMGGYCLELSSGFLSPPNPHDICTWLHTSIHIWEWLVQCDG